MAAEVGENAIDIALKVARALNAVGAEYFVGGSLASSLQGEPRATNDIDTNMLRDAVLHARCANAFYLPVVTKIDFFGRGDEPFDESEFARRRVTTVTTGGDSLVVKAPEDTVLRKLLWYREGGEVSDKQWRDIVLERARG